MSWKLMIVNKRSEYACSNVLNGYAIITQRGDVHKNSCIILFNEYNEEVNIIIFEYNDNKIK